MNKQIAIIGMGHMGKALEKGFLSGGIKKGQLSVSNNSVGNSNAIEKVDWIVITVKPHAAKGVIQELGEGTHNKIIISAVAALSLSKIASFTKNKMQKVIRIMPNLPVAYNEGIIGFYANEHVSQAEKTEVIQDLSLLGTVINCKSEEELNAVTVTAGCGPAVVSYFISLLEKSGKSFGLSKESSAKVSLQAFIGTLRLLEETNQTAQELQSSVATKGGVTQEILKSLDAKRVPQLFVESLESGYGKIKKLEEEL